MILRMRTFCLDRQWTHQTTRVVETLDLSHVRSLGIGLHHIFGEGYDTGDTADGNFLEIKLHRPPADESKYAQAEEDLWSDFPY